MHLKTVKRRFFRNLHDYGFWICLKKFVSSVLRAFYKNVNVIIYRLDIESNVKEPINLSSFAFKLLSDRDHEEIAQVEEMAEWLEGKLKYNLVTKKLCMASFDNNKLIGFYLASFEEVFIPQLSLRVILRPDQVWAEEIMIHRKYRGKGLATELKYRIYLELQNRGINTLYACVSVYNKASLKSAEKFELTKAFHVKYLKFLSFKKLIFWEILNNKSKNKKYNLLSRLTEEEDLGNKKITIKGKTEYYHIEPTKKKKYFFKIKTSEFLSDT